MRFVFVIFFARVAFTQPHPLSQEGVLDGLFISLLDFLAFRAAISSSYKGGIFSAVATTGLRNVKKIAGEGSI